MISLDLHKRIHDRKMAKSFLRNKEGNLVGDNREVLSVSQSSDYAGIQTLGLYSNQRLQLRFMSKLLKYLVAGESPQCILDI